MNITEQSDRAERLDDLNSPEFTQWIGLSRQADSLRRKLMNIRTQGRFTAAVAVNGCLAEAVQAAHVEVEALSALVQNAADAQALVHDDRRELSRMLNPTTSHLIDNARRLRERNAALSGERGEIQRSRERRERAISDLVEAGLDRELAEQQARPTVADIEALRCELAAIPGDMERNSALMSSYAGRLELHLADVDSRSDDDDGDAA